MFDNVGARGTLGAGKFHIGGEATSAEHRVIYDDDTGDMYFDADGSGGIVAIKFATLDAGLKLSHDNLVVI